jgi:hypothetical protein
MDFDNDYETLPTASVMTHMTAGAVAGVMEHCVMYPMDCVKVWYEHILLYFPCALYNYEYLIIILRHISYSHEINTEVSCDIT